jgi:flavin-dependent dehydrogenase
LPLADGVEKAPVIAPTGTWQSLVASHWEVIVIGAGPAGAMAALVSSRLGLRTLLVDRSTFPRDKVCGGCLNGAALAELSAIGLESLPAQLGGLRYTRFRFSARNAEAMLDLPRGIAISRTVFDTALIREAIASGSSFLPATSAIDAGLEPQWRHVTLQRGSQAAVVKAHWIVAADGLAGRYTSSCPEVTVYHPDEIYLGLAPETLPCSGYASDTIHMAWHPQGYAGVVNVDDGLVHVAAALKARWLKSHTSPAMAVSEILRGNRWPIPRGLASAHFKGTPRLRACRRPVSFQRVFLVGDAAGYIEPITGEGIAWALRGGRAAALRLPEAIRGKVWQVAATDWDRAYREMIQSRQRLCALTADGLRHPLWTQCAVAVLGVAPVLARPIVHALNRSGKAEPSPWPSGL